MLPLHDKTRRRICLAVFFLLCLTPTALVVAWCVAWQLPSHKTAEIARLRQQTGLVVALDGLRHLQPGTVLYEGLTLSDPETGRTVLRCPRLEATWTRDADPEGRPKTVVLLTASQPRIEADSAHRLGQLLDRILQNQGDWADVEFRLSAGEVALSAGEDSRTLRDVEGTIEAIRGGVQAEAVFRLPGPATPQPLMVRLTRNRQVAPPATGWELDTGGNPLPCSLLSVALAELKPLGPRSRFRGHIWANQTPGGWAAQFEGQLEGLDLAGLLGERFPHKLSGPAGVSIASARLWQGRVEKASGTLRAGPGQIDRSLLRAAVEQLHMVRMAEPMTAGDLCAYDQLALGFQIDAGGLRMQGCCTGVEAGTVLADRAAPLLAEPIAQPQPLAALVQALAPASLVQLPATPQADWLARWLPVPQADRSGNPPPALPQPSLRLGRALQR
jgi:hypothetical protein